MGAYSIELTTSPTRSVGSGFCFKLEQFSTLVEHGRPLDWVLDWLKLTFLKRDMTTLGESKWRKSGIIWL